MRNVTPDWLTFSATPEGRTTLAWEDEAFARTAGRLSGDRAVQLGLPVLDPFQKSPIGHQILVTEDDVALSEDDWRCPVTADFNALPLKGECADLVVWPHGADTPAVDPEETLQEISRILAPSGVLVLTFFNASGGWNLKKRLLGRSVFPEGIVPQSPGAVKALVSRAGLTVEGGFYGVYGTTEGGKTGLLPSRLDLAGNRWWPTLSNVVLLTARKKVQGMTFVGRAAFADNKVRAGALQHG